MGNSQKRINGIYYFLLLLFFIPQYSCNTVDPPDKTVLTLTLEDVSCNTTAPSIKNIRE